MGLIPFARLIRGLALVAGLSGCEPTVMAPETTTSHSVTRSLNLLDVPRSRDSTSAERYYLRRQNELLVKGLLRQDGGGVDTAFDAEDLARNFVQIALFSEYESHRGGFLASQSADKLRRWRDPVRVMVHFGPATTEVRRQRDRAFLTRYLSRLSRATRHPVSLTRDESHANFHLFVATIDEQRALRPILEQLGTDMGRNAITNFATRGRSDYCYVFTLSSEDEPAVLGQAVALVRAELPDLMRDACYQEELAQGLGLVNDSPAARPSIFNDDEEFALLTDHDELLLRMLYDPRLQPGMTPDHARPIVAEIAAELVDSNI